MGLLGYEAAKSDCADANEFPSELAKRSPFEVDLMNARLLRREVNMALEMLYFFLINHSSQEQIGQPIERLNRFQIRECIKPSMNRFGVTPSCVQFKTFFQLFGCQRLLG